MKSKWYILLIALLGLSLNIGQAEAKKMNVIVDTDCDMDDMMAILYLMKRKDIHILAITTTGTGMVTWKYSAPNIKKLVKLGNDPKIPVSYGAKQSLSPYAQFPSQWREGVNEIFNLPMPENHREISPLPSWKLMADKILNSKEKVFILSLAPMTNIALALKNEPSILQNIDQVVISGGAVAKKKGNIVGKPQGFQNDCAEYNIFLDAKAAQDVISSGAEILLVPLNATEKAPITPTLFEAFKNIKRNPSANFVYEVLKPFADTQKNTDVYLWDPVAAAVMTNPDIGGYELMKISVNQTPGPCYGCIDEDPSGTSVVVCYNIDAAAFYSLFYKTITRGRR